MRRILFRASRLSSALVLPLAFQVSCNHFDASRTAFATITPGSGSSIRGQARFREVEVRGVEITLEIEGASPGEHAVHIHEKGECHSDFTSAGGHFNPYNKPHAAPTDRHHHAGDLGNISVGADGRGALRIDSIDITLAPGPRCVIGRSLIIHERPDDFVTQPTGNAGRGIGCGEIQSP